MEQESSVKFGASGKHAAEVELRSFVPAGCPSLDLCEELRSFAPAGRRGCLPLRGHRDYDFSIRRKSPEVALTATFSLALSRLSP